MFLRTSMDERNALVCRNVLQKVCPPAPKVARTQAIRTTPNVQSLAMFSEQRIHRNDWVWFQITQFKGPERLPGFQLTLITICQSPY